MGPLNDENKLKLTKIRKTEKIEKSLKIYNVINFNAIRYKLTASGNVVHSIISYKLMRPVSILRLHKSRQKQKNQKKKLSEKIVEAVKK